ncbi:hypothetical protein ACF0H5_014252 [Mactra antiquata]
MDKLFQQSYYWGNGRQPYCGLFGHSFIKRLCKKPHYWRHMPFSGEAHGTGGLRTSTLLQLLRRCNLSKFDAIFIQIGENDMLDMNNHQLMYALVAVYEEARRQGVRHVCFGSMFLRHNRNHNKRAKRLNKILWNIHPSKVWFHDSGLISTASIDPRDRCHLKRNEEKNFADSIARCLHHLLRN